MRRTISLLVSLLLVWAWLSPTQAQTAPTGPIEDILVQGTDDVLQGLVKVSINVSVGDDAATVKPDEIRQQVLGLGYFQDAKAEVRSENGKVVLVITVTPNPKVGAISFKGNSLFPAEALTRFLDEQLQIGTGATVNNARLEESRTALAQVYRRQGLPFTPAIKLEQSPPGPDGTINLTYTIDESAPVKALKVEGATLVPEKDIEAAFKPLVERGSYNSELYRAAILRTRDAYEKLGYRGSGPDLERTELVDGTLTVVLTEFKVVAIDATALGVDPGTLSLKVGDFFNYAKLLADVQSLAKGRDKQVRLNIEQTGADTVAVTLTLEDEPAGPIKEIKFEGNTAVTSETLQKGLKQKVGDTYNAVIAQEDFNNVVQTYDAAGYRILTQPRISYREGVYTISVRELKVLAYEIAWRGQHRTQDFVIARELPKPGLFNVTVLRRSFTRINQLGIINPSSLGNISSKTPDPEKPDEVVLLLELEEDQTGSIQPGFTYSSLSGAEGSLAYEERNLFGLNNRVNVRFQGGPNDAGQWLTGGVSYTIPWIYLDFLDFKEVPTPVSFSVSTDVFANTPIPNQPANTATQFQREYTTRSTGFSIGLSRPINLGENRPVNETFTVGLSVGLKYDQNFLENADDDTTKYFTTVAAGNAWLQTNAADTFTVIPRLSAEYSTRNRQDFPTSGFTVSSSVGYGLGSKGSDPLSWSEFTVGFRTYLGFGFNDAGDFGLGEDRNIALAFRFNTGAILGSAPPNSQFRIGDSTSDVFGLRGYSFRDLTGDVFYTGSLELRYDFGLRTNFTYGLLGIAFLDFGNAWGNGTRASRPDGSSIPFGIQFGYGLGVQLNLQLGPVPFPPLGFYYGFSPWNPGGKFHFTFGFRF